MIFDLLLQLYIYLCMHIHARTYTHTHTHTHTHTQLQHTHTNKHAHTHPCIKYLICMYICRNHRILQEAPQHYTRFISLANVGDPDKKQRFLYAFNITPLSNMSSNELTAQPQSSTDCPYTKSVTTHHQPQVGLYR